jgi:hypothetical protein
MHDTLQRLYKTKMALLATILTVVGVALLIAAQWVQARGVRWLAEWPLSDFGSALFTTGLVTIAYNYLDSRDSEERASERLERVIRKEAPAIRDAVIDGFAFNAEDLARVATPETLDQVIRNSLALRLGDPVFASEVYGDVRDQAVRAAERWHDAKVSIDLSPLVRASGKGHAMLVTTVRWEYSVVPKWQSRRFACVSDRDEYRELAQDSSATSAWFVHPGGVDAAAQETFELLQFSVDGEARPISRAVRKSGQVYTVNLGKESLDEEQPVVISYTYRALSPLHGHLLHFDIEQPTRGVDIELDYGGCGIAYVNVLDFIASARKTRVSQSPPGVPGRNVSVQFDGWVFPRSGVAFVWVLEDELTTSRTPHRRPLADSALR